MDVHSPSSSSPPYGIHTLCKLTNVGALSTPRACRLSLNMPFDAATLGLIEDALSGCFKFHTNLDAFLIRSGMPADRLAEARARAEARNSGGRFSKAPKRIVVQEVLTDLAALGSDGDKIVAALVTGLAKSTFRDASPDSLAAIEALRSKIDLDREQKNEERRQQEEERARATRSTEQKREAERAATRAKRDLLRDRFTGLLDEANTQKRGYLLETFLNDLFEFEGLDPRRSFKLKGEQIDGSFSSRGRTCLVEAKWTKDPAAGAEFGAFNYKIEGKTVDTRGLYISVNGYSREAIEGMRAKGALKFVCIDGAHVMRALVSDDGIIPILDRIWRHADETGDAYLPVSLL